jgi:hypothetical protein
MKTFNVFAIVLLVFAFWSCEQQEDMVKPEEGKVSKEIIAQLNATGFNTVDFEVRNIEGVYLVEKDIVLTYDQIMSMPKSGQIPNVEQYNTDNLVTGTPRTIRVYVNMPQKYINATDIALARYNGESLNLTFQRVTSSSGADIIIKASPWYYYFFGILGSAGFPTAAGNPHNEILMTRAYYDNVANINGLATTIAHEMGHCIGFRHTDYMDRSYSCGGAASDEGASTVGANHIPGTPTGPDAGSWMLACGSPEGDRPFTANDKIALGYLY